MASAAPLPELAAAILQVTILPFWLATWTNYWFLTSILVIFWQIIISEGFGVDSPFPYANPNDDFDGRRIVNTGFVIYIIAFAFLGKLLNILLKLPTMLNIFSIIPNRLLNNSNKSKTNPSKLVFFVSLFFIIIALLGTYLTYKQLLNHNQNLPAVVFVNLFPIVVFILGYLMFRFWGAMFKGLKKQLLSQYPEYEGDDKKGTAVKTMILLYFITLGILVIIGNFILSVIIYFKFDINWALFASIPVFFLIFVLIIIMMLIARSVMRRFGKLKKKPKPEQIVEEESKTEKLNYYWKR